ncbi:sperm microtubule inner protein 8-like [Babylonia areolata]|uniref:sperm microtubule inner protein 8-like n=1 Tax=Babylonia areolata TaxID=304850 RepID=UPI003FCFDF12
MTTVGVRPKVVDRVHAMEMPSYSYHYPHIKRVQLAAVKNGVYNPSLPTLRRMDMDDNRQMLTDEHSRTSTTLGPVDFARVQSSPFKPASHQFHGMNMTELGRAHHRLYTTPDELKKAREEWSKFLCKCPERYDIKLPELPDSKDLHFTGYAVRYLRPDVTRSWKPFTLQQEPNIHMYDQKPIPATTYGRYRDPFPKHFRKIASEAWR